MVVGTSGGCARRANPTYDIEIEIDCLSDWTGRIAKKGLPVRARNPFLAGRIKMRYFLSSAAFGGARISAVHALAKSESR